MFFLPRILPAKPSEYPLLASGEDRRWWRVLLGLAAGTIVVVILSIAVVFPFLALDTSGVIIGSLDLGNDIDMTDPLIFSMMMLSLIIFIPAALIAALLGFRYRLGYLFSVEGRIRWAWLGKTYTVTLIFFGVIYLGLALFEGTTFHPAENIWLIVILVLILTPLQSAAEEIVFRGLVMQVIGTWFPRPPVTVVLSTVVSAVLFSLAHGSLDPGILVQLAGFAAFCIYLTWKTGGLEAAIAFHAGNNVSIFLIEAFEGQTSSIITEDTTATAGVTVFSLVIGVFLVALLTWMFTKTGRSNTHDPMQRPQPTLTYLHKRLTKGEFIPEYAHLYPAHVAGHYGYHQHYEL